jgi:hypothetical protein
LDAGRINPVWILQNACCSQTHREQFSITALRGRKSLDGADAFDRIDTTILIRINHFRLANELHISNVAEMNQQGVVVGLDLLVDPIFREQAKRCSPTEARILRLTPASLRWRGV